LIISTYEAWLDWPNLNRVFAVELTAALKRDTSVTKTLYLCTGSMDGYWDTVFDDSHAYAPVVVSIPEIVNRAQGIFANSGLVSFGKIKLGLSSNFPLDPAASWDAWTASTSYSYADIVRPTTVNGWYYVCVQPGTTGSTEPTWPIIEGELIYDGTVTWEAQQLTVDRLSEDWILDGRTITVKHGGPNLAWANWGTVCTGYMGAPSRTETTLDIPVKSAGVKAAQTKLPHRFLDPETWTAWEATKVYDTGALRAPTTAQYVTFSGGTPLSSAYWSQPSTKWAPANAFDGDVTIYAPVTDVLNRWLSARGTDADGTAYIGYDLGVGITKALTRIRIFQMTECCITSAKVQYSSNGSVWNDLTTISFGVEGNAWEEIDISGASAYRYWRLLANSSGANKWKVFNFGEWGIYEIEFQYTGRQGYIFCATTGGTSGGSEPSWDYTPGNTTNDNTVVWYCLALPDGSDQIPVPHVYGYAGNITPVCIDQPSSGQGKIYIFHDPDADEVSSVDVVYMNGVPLTVTTDYLAYPATGILKLDSGLTIDGTITMNVTGSKLGATYSASPGYIITYWLTNFAGVDGGDIDSTAMTQLNTDLPYAFGLYLKNQQDIKTCIDALLSGTGAWYSITRAGKHTVGKLGTPNPSDALVPWLPKTEYAVGDFVRPFFNDFWYECTTAGRSGAYPPSWPESDSATVSDGTAVPVTWTAREMTAGAEAFAFTDPGDSLGFASEPEERLVWRVVIKCARNWTMQQINSTDVSPARREWVGKQWREFVVESTDIKDRYPLAEEYEAETALVLESQAIPLAQNLLGLFGTKRNKISLTLPPQGMDVEVGDDVVLSRDRAGWKYGKYFYCVGHRDDFDNGRTTLELWG
jgi:hypothetical protein